MKVLVVGSGGREHALVWKLAQSTRVEKLYAAPGNGGIQQVAECVNVSADNINALVDFASQSKVDLTIVGPELPLVNGIVDEFERHGLTIFGPTRSAAMLEGSKVFAKELMERYGIPTARGKVFSNSEEAKDYIKCVDMPVVIKAEGLAAGKGVSVCRTIEEAISAIGRTMEQRVFGNAGDRVIVEEYLQGEEVSILAFSDGERVIPLVPSQDHKRIYDNDEGPNTGGMGAYSPVPLITEELSYRIQSEILEPTIKGMAEEGKPYRGILYAGLMLTSTGPKVLEFNVRFGDPETQVVLPRLESDLVEPIMATIRGELSGVRLQWSRQACVCVVLASGGYPGKYEKGIPIEGLDSVVKMDNVVIFHAGTKVEKDRCITSGGRVLGVTALGDTLEDAINLSYHVVSKIDFKNKHFRKDIGRRALRRNYEPTG